MTNATARLMLNHPQVIEYVKARCEARLCFARYQTMQGEHASKRATRAYACSDRKAWPTLDAVKTWLDERQDVTNAETVFRELR